MNGLNGHGPGAQIHLVEWTQLGLGPRLQTLPNLAYPAEQTYHIHHQRSSRLNTESETIQFMREVMHVRAQYTRRVSVVEYTHSLPILSLN